jgi:4-aminobutyrate aminotransferase
MFAGSDQGKAVLDYIRMLFERSVPASEVAAILVEPIQGEGGYIVPPDGFLAGLRALCDEHGILLIFDEVQSGIGRTGRMFASQHWGVQPDIMTLAKGLGSGLPIGAMVAKKRLMSQWKRGAHGNTYGGNPIACAAANATIDLVENGMMGNAATVGAHFLARLRDLARDYPCVGEVRGKGLMIGMELIEGDAERTPARKLCDDVVTRAFHNGLLLLSCGASTVRFMPPLNVTREEIDEALVLLRSSLDEALLGQED